jgi:predicted alpha-1,2-mannosidase
MHPTVRRRARRCVAAATVLAAALLTPVAAQAATATTSGQTVTDPAALVDPFVGTGSGNSIVGQVDTFPGADMPFGMVQWSPDTPSRPDGGGYNYADSDLTGFSLTHFSGPGCAIAGDFPVLPMTGAVPSDPSDAQAAFSHDSEVAHPGSYAVTAGGVRTSLAVTDRTGVARFTYPATTSAQLLFKVADSSNGGSAATFQTVGDDEVTGAVTSGGFCGQPDTYTVYFAARFDSSFTSSGTWGGTTAANVTRQDGGTVVKVNGKQDPARMEYGEKASTQGSGVVAGGWVTFDTTKNPNVGMQVAISNVSVAGALGNLKAEAHTWNVGSVAAQATAAWNRQLATIGIAGGSLTARQEFYTALYHASLEPSLFSDANGSYVGFDDKIHTAARGHAQYADYSGWDIYRSEVPLLATIDPHIADDMATSLLNDESQGGWLPKWPVANGYTGVMNGDSADPILADAYAFGDRGFDAATALTDMVHGADDSTGTPGQGWYVERPNGAAYITDGYVPNVGSDSISPVPNGASETLEYALDDFSISRLALDLGASSTARTFTDRSQNWENVFDTADGYVEPRDASGAFPSGPAVPTLTGFGQDGFQEGNAAQYTWMVPQDLAGLVKGIGGDAATNARLDDYFSQLNAGPNEPYDWAGNEPALDTPWAYDSTGEPWQTQQVVREITSQLYSLTPGGEPGNDDLGAMSSWYVWATLGVYPQTPGEPTLVLGAPQFSTEVIHGAHGNLVINAREAGDTYVQSLRVDGRSSDRTWINLDSTHSLDFTLSATPNKHWGAAASDAPPSHAAGPVHFPASTRAALDLSPGQVRLSPGSSTSIQVTNDNSLGTSSTPVTWKATAASGVTVSPASGTITASAGGTASASVTISALASMAPGYYQVTFTSAAANGALIPAATLLVTVAASGQSIPTAYVSNYSDNTVTPVDTSTDTAGPPIPVGSGPDGMIVTGGLLFVANNNSNNVTVINTTTNAVAATIPVGSIAADVSATPDGKTVWVSNFGSGTVQPIDVATLTAGTPVTVGTNPERLAVSPDGSRLWVANQGSGTVSDVSLATDTVTSTIAVGASPFGVAVTPDSSQVYVTNGGSSSVSVISASTDAVTSTIATGADPQYVQISPSGSVAYVADAGAGGVTPITVSTGSPGAFIATGSGAYAVGFNPAGTIAWVVDSNVNNVVPVTVATGVAGTAVTVGNVPDGVTVTG